MDITPTGEPIGLELMVALMYKSVFGRDPDSIGDPTLLIDAMQELSGTMTQFGQVVDNQVIVPRNEAVQNIANWWLAGGSKWANEMFFQTGVLQSGTNDVPLGMVVPYTGVLTQVRFRCASNTRSNPVTLSVMKNNIEAESFVVEPGIVNHVADMTVPLSADDVVNLSVGDVSVGTGAISSVSIMFAGKFQL